MPDKSQAAVELGRKGGQSTLAKHGREHFVRAGQRNRKPMAEVSKHALYMREYRRRKGQSCDGIEHPKG